MPDIPCHWLMSNWSISSFCHNRKGMAYGSVKHFLTVQFFLMLHHIVFIIQSSFYCRRWAVRHVGGPDERGGPSDWTRAWRQGHLHLCQRLGNCRGGGAGLPSRRSLVKPRAILQKTRSVLNKARRTYSWRCIITASMNLKFTVGILTPKNLNLWKSTADDFFAVQNVPEFILQFPCEKKKKLPTMARKDVLFETWEQNMQIRRATTFFAFLLTQIEKVHGLRLE